MHFYSYIVTVSYIGEDAVTDLQVRLERTDEIVKGHEVE